MPETLKIMTGTKDGFSCFEEFDICDLFGIWILSFGITQTTHASPLQLTAHRLPFPDTGPYSIFLGCPVLATTLFHNLPVGAIRFVSETANEMGTWVN